MPSGGGGASLPAPSPARRLLATCPPFPLNITNGCPVYKIQVTVLAQLSQDAGTGQCINTNAKAGDWCMRRLPDLDPGAQVQAFTNLTNTEYYI